MNKETLNYKSQSAIRNYLVVIVLFILIAILSKSLGDTNELLMLKLAAVPLFFLSFGGLRLIYKHPIIEHKITLRSVEYSVLDGLLFTLFIFISLWKHGETATELSIRFGLFFLIFTAIKLTFLVFDVRKISSLKKNERHRQ